MEPSFSEEEARDSQLEVIFRAQAADLYQFIYRQVRAAAIAEDLTSTVFLKALRWLQQSRSQESVKGWLYATARSLIADYWREHAQLPLVPLEAAEDLPLLADASDAQVQSLQVRIQRLLDALPTRERDILTLRYFQGYSAAEIGEVLGLSANYVRVLQFRALRRAAILEAQERSGSMTSPVLPYNEQAQRVLELTRAEARRLQHNYMGTEHVLLGILSDGSAPGAAALINGGITPEKIRAGITFLTGHTAKAQPGFTPQTTPGATVAEPGFTLRTQYVLVMAGEAAQRLGQPAISPQQLLEAILREGQGVAAMLLQVSGVRWQEVGDALQINVTPDEAGKPVALPDLLEHALQRYPDEHRIFEKLSGLKQLQLADWVTNAQGEEAKKQAVERVVQILRLAHQNNQQSQQS
jgi:RNA polymerase sigma-70 factor (ECF subfamily)